MIFLMHIPLHIGLFSPKEGFTKQLLFHNNSFIYLFIFWIGELIHQNGTGLPFVGAIKPRHHLAWPNTPAAFHLA
jgi:hypothetical protein